MPTTSEACCAREVHDARRRRANGEIGAAELRAVEDAAIADAVRKLEETGMRSVTDGEFRRAWFHLDFLQQLDGVAVTGNIAASSDAADTVHMTPPKLSVTGPLRHARESRSPTTVPGAVTTATPKVCIPSPTMVQFRGGRAAIDIESYPDLDEFFTDLAACYRDEIAALYAAGCRYLQLDDTNLAYLCDPVMRQGAVDRGDDPDDAAADVRRADQRGAPRATRRPHGVRAPVPWQLPQHLVRPRRLRTGRRGVVHRARLSTPTSWSTTTSDRATSPRCASCPTARQVVLGLVTSKRPELESVDELARRVDEAAAYVPLDRLCLSPQCGFASTVEGNALTEDEQWAKLRLVIDTAAHIWG